MVRQQHQLFVALLCIADAAVVALACFGAWAVRRVSIEQWWPGSWETYFKEPLVFFAVPIALYLFWLGGLYRPRRDRSLWSEQKRSTQMSLLTVAAMIVVMWLVGNDLVDERPDYAPVQVGSFAIDAARVQLGSLAVILPLGMAVHRLVFRLSLRRLRRMGWNQRHAAVIGVGRLGQITGRTIGRNSWTGISVSYFISHHDRTQRYSCLNKPVFGGLADLERLLEEHPVDAVYLALPNSRAAAMRAVLERLERFSVDVRIVPDFSPRYVAQGMAISELDGMPVLSYRECPLYGLGGFGKRVVDLVIGSLALAVFAVPMLVIAGLVRLSGPGPVIFRQRRVSLGGEVFEIYKFRTMRQIDDEIEPSWTERDDPRITPIGRVLRRLSLDELPQLLNVLKGDMSLVGPRPERPELIERFREDWRGYMLRQHVKAGMTGWAQVRGLRGDTCLRKRLQHDMYYIRHWSLGFDLKILWLTIFRGFLHRNAH